MGRGLGKMAGGEQGKGGNATAAAKRSCFFKTFRTYAPSFVGRSGGVENPLGALTAGGVHVREEAGIEK